MPKSLYEKILQAEKATTVQEIVDKENSKRLRVHMPCKVVKVHGNSVDVEIQGKEDSGFGYYTEFPLLLDLPIIYNNYTSIAYIITPIQVGDTGLVEFLDFNTSNFADSGNTSITSDSYPHALNNGVFINGFIPNSNVIDISGKSNDFVSKKNNPTMLIEPTDELWDRPKVQNDDGTYSTAVSMTIGIDLDGTPALAVIPSVYDGKHHTQEEAIDRFYKTHKHFGIFSAENPGAVEAYSEGLHNAQAKYNAENELAIIIGLHNKSFRLTVDPIGALTITSANEISVKSNLGIKLDTPDVSCTNGLTVGSGASGTFKAGDKTVTVANGIVTSIS